MQQMQLYDFQTWWKDVMKLDLKNIDPDVRTAWEKQQQQQP